MTIVKWLVGSYAEAPERKEYDKETDCFYIWKSGRMKTARRDAKASTFYRYFNSEAEALDFIRQRKEDKAERRRIDQIKQHAAELLEAAERYLAFRHAGDTGMGYEYSGVHPETQLKAVIAKAKGEA